MSNRRALLIGAAEYGPGFARLPAVREDVRILGAALQARGYEVDILSDEDTRDTVHLDDRIRDFCASGGPEDIRLVYFSGHGILADDVDWIIPAGTDRNAVVSTAHRVSTDRSRQVAASRTGLVLFVIDACRDEASEPVTKGGAGWGNTRTQWPTEHRFIRLFGCASTEVCQVLPGEPSASVFTTALAQSLAAGSSTLDALLEDVASRCDELTLEHDLRHQRPHLSYGELSAEKRALLALPIFERTADAAAVLPSVLPTVWSSFHPDKLHCLVVLSESDQRTGADVALDGLVDDALQAGTGKKIWDAFVAARGGHRLASGKKRALPAEFTSESVAFAKFPVNEALASVEAFDKAVRAVVEADLVVFDVTAFEPGVMLLIGIRSACARSLTICSHGARWREGQPLEVPFNLQDLNIGSHTPSEMMVAPDPVLERFVSRVEVGFRQLARQPRYLDLPSYDALRELGSDYDASSSIPLHERVLVLCSYAPNLLQNWRRVASRLRARLSQRGNPSRVIERVIDGGTPQLISQSVYELIRRSVGCVVDWSGYSASVFLELGVRLAVSEWGAVQIVDASHLPGGERAPDLAQIEQLRQLFSPIAYQPTSGDAVERAADLLLERTSNKQAEFNRIHRALLPIMGEVQEAHPPLADLLRRRADALHHPQQEREGAPQILFHGSRGIKKDSEKAACELRVASWLYLEHRVGHANLKADPDALALYLELGRAAADALYDLGDAESIELATYIDDRLSALD
ncbi:MAG TPA: caspase family protein [Thermoanaerobaculia bacterium]